MLVPPGDLSGKLAGIWEQKPTEWEKKLKNEVYPRVLAVGRALAEAPTRHWKSGLEALGQAAGGSDSPDRSSPLRLAIDVAVASLRKRLLEDLEGHLARGALELRVAPGETSQLEGAWVGDAASREELRCTLAAYAGWLELAAAIPTPGGRWVSGLSLPQDHLPPDLASGLSAAAAREVAPLLAFLAARGPEHEAWFPIVIGPPHVAEGGLVHARLSLLRPGLGEPGVHVAPWSVFRLAKGVLQHLGDLLRLQYPTEAWVISLEPSVSTWEKTVSELEIEGGSLGFALCSAAVASATGRSLVDFVASASLEIKGGGLVLRPVNGLEFKLGPRGALHDWVAGRAPLDGRARTIVVERSNWEEADQWLGRLAKDTKGGGPSDPEILRRLVNRDPGGALLYPRALVSPAESQLPVAFDGVVDQLVLLDPKIRAALAVLAGEPAPLEEASDRDYQAKLDQETATSLPGELKILPLPFNADPQAWARRLSRGPAQAVLGNQVAPVPVALRLEDLLRPGRLVGTLREALQKVAPGSANPPDQVLLNRLHTPRGYTFFLVPRRSLEPSPWPSPAALGTALKPAVEKLRAAGDHTITFLASDIHEALALAADPDLAPDSMEVERIAALHPAPWRLSFLGKHMEGAARSKEGLLALGPKGLDRDLEVEEYFRVGEEVAGERRAGMEPGEKERPYYIMEEVFPYTPPTAPEAAATWLGLESDEVPATGGARAFPPGGVAGGPGDPGGAGKTLAEVLRRARKPVLLTGCSGSGKTLLTRHLFWKWTSPPTSPGGNGPARLFVAIDGFQLDGIESRQGESPAHEVSVARAVANALCIHDSLVGRIVEWLDHSPPVLFVFDLNRCATTAGIKVLEAVLGCRWNRGQTGFASSSHQFLIIYRTQSSLTDRDSIWKKIDPATHQTVGCELRDVDFDSAKHYFRAARCAWARAEGNTADPRQEEGALEALAHDHKRFLGVPLLLHFAATVAGRLQDLETLSDLYRSVIDAHIERELLAPAVTQAGSLARPVKCLTCAVSLEFTANAVLARAARHTSPAPKSPGEESPSEQEQGLFFGKTRDTSEMFWTDPDLLDSALRLGGHWKEHFERTVSSYLEGFRPSGAEERDRLVLQSSVFTPRGNGLHYVHDSFAYYFSAYLLRYPGGLQKPRPEDILPRGGEAPAFLRRIAAILKADPVFWYLRAEFLGGLLPVTALHWLVFEGILGDPVLEQAVTYKSTEDWEQLALIFLASRLARGLGTREPRGSEAANALRRFHQFGWPAPTKVHAPVEELVSNWRSLLPKSATHDLPIFVLPEEKPRAPAAGPAAAISWEEALGQVEGSEAYRRARPAKPWRAMLAGLRGEENLVPLGLDPGSRLLELADLRTGRAPRRSAESGALLVEEGGAQIFVLLPGGERDLGSPPGESGRWDDENLHSAEIAPFLMGKHPLTQGQWRRALELLPAGREASRWEELAEALAVPAGERHHLEEATRSLREVIPLHTGSELLPMENVSWYQASVLLELLGYRLPAEAEWEYACRGTDGEQLAIPSGAPLGAQAWFLGNSEGRPHQVGAKAPNGFGLHDLLGNVWEWCLDWYETEYGAWRGRGEPGFCALSGSSFRVLRGGSCLSLARRCRSARRNRYAPFHGNGGIGFGLSRPLL